MALTDTQVRQLKAKLDAKHVKTRKADGANLHYVEGWHVIAEANRIFGYDAWDRRTLSSRCVWSGESGTYHGAAYSPRCTGHYVKGFTGTGSQRERGGQNANRNSNAHCPYLASSLPRGTIAN